MQWQNYISWLCAHKPRGFTFIYSCIFLTPTGHRKLLVKVCCSHNLPEFLNLQFYIPSDNALLHTLEFYYTKKLTERFVFMISKTKTSLTMERMMMMAGSGGMLVVLIVVVAVMIKWCCPHHHGWEALKIMADLTQRYWG